MWTPKREGKLILPRVWKDLDMVSCLQVTTKKVRKNSLYILCSKNLPKKSIKIYYIDFFIFYYQKSQQKSTICNSLVLRRELVSFKVSNCSTIWINYCELLILVQVLHIKLKFDLWLWQVGKILINDDS